MKAAVMHEPNKPLVIEDVTINKPAAREVLLRTAYAGLCHSDLHFIEGLYPHPTPVVRSQRHVRTPLTRAQSEPGQG